MTKRKAPIRETPAQMMHVKQKTPQRALVDWSDFANALAYAVKQDFDKVIESLDGMIRLQPGVAALYYCRGYMYCRRYNFDKAIRDYGKALQIEPGNVAAYISRGRAHFDRGNLDKAVEDFTRAIRLEPENRAAYFDRSQAYAKKGDQNKADEDYGTFNRLPMDRSDILSQEEIDALLSPRSSCGRWLIESFYKYESKGLLSQEEVEALLGNLGSE